mmetsp:Transcript_1115/g.2303  ORF Transcript_1115/g.2303 Transcript_1115/m.2303 type:complete len:301 (+) Transcript_1115:306-1208(+)
MLCAIHLSGTGIRGSQAGFAVHREVHAGSGHSGLPGPLPTRASPAVWCHCSRRFCCGVPGAVPPSLLRRAHAAQRLCIHSDDVCAGGLGARRAPRARSWDGDYGHGGVPMRRAAAASASGSVDDDHQEAKPVASGGCGDAGGRVVSGADGGLRLFFLEARAVAGGRGVVVQHLRKQKPGVGSHALPLVLHGCDAKDAAGSAVADSSRGVLGPTTGWNFCGCHLLCTAVLQPAPQGAALSLPGGAPVQHVRGGGDCALPPECNDGETCLAIHVLFVHWCIACEFSSKLGIHASFQMQLSWR